MSAHRPALAPPPDYAGPRRSLILAGGGMRVAWQAGVLRALQEAGLVFHHGDGTSGGTMNLSMMLSGLTPVEMCDRWRTLNVKQFASALPLKDYLKPHDLIAMGDADGIVKHVFPHLGIDVDRIRDATGMNGTFNVCNYSRKTNEVIPHTKVSMDYLIAGISLPIFMPPVQIGKDLYLDSVWIKDANLMEAVRQGAEELWVVWCIGNVREYKHGFFNQYVHMIEISANGSLFEEFERIREINQRIEQGEVVYGHRKPIRLHVIRPEYALPLDPEFYLGRITAAELVDRGYGDAQKYLSNMKPEGLPFEPEVTLMKEDSVGLSFRETMSGGFALGETEPQAGEKKGRQQDTELSMHANVMIRDMKSFTDDPTHTGELTGNLDFAPFGEAIPATKGVFQLFYPEGDSGMKYMVYEMGFEHGGKQYYLAGRKEVKDDRGIDLWKDTTTLFTRLHEGSDSGGPVVGAGILSLGVGDLVKLVSTVEVHNASSLTEKAQTVAAFGKFFMGELWDTYMK